MKRTKIFKYDFASAAAAVAAEDGDADLYDFRYQFAVLLSHHVYALRTCKL